MTTHTKGQRDARLMAAAPDMLAALEAVARSPDCARAVAEYNAVLAAIAKAKGDDSPLTIG